MSQVYRLDDVPRSITWDEVRLMLDAVERRTIRGRRDYAILLLLVTYGLRAHEVAKLTLDDVDWKRERLQVLERKAGHATAYPLAAVVGEALIDYLKRGRPETSDRHLFFRALAPQAPITAAAVSSSVALYLQRAGVKVRRAGSALRHLRECRIDGVLRGGLVGWLLFGRSLHDFRCLDRRENQGGCVLNDFKALGQKCRVSVVKMYVVGGGVSCV
jgi:integrase